MELKTTTRKEVIKQWHKDKRHVECSLPVNWRNLADNGKERFFAFDVASRNAQTNYVRMFRVKDGEVRMKTLATATVSKGQAPCFIKTDASIGFFDHVFDRYCERVCGMYAKKVEDGLWWPQNLGQRAARFLFDTEDMPYVFVGVTDDVNLKGEHDCGVAVLGNHLLILKMDEPCGFPIAKTFIDESRVANYPDQLETVRLARLGQTDAALRAYNRYVAKKIEYKKA